MSRERVGVEAGNVSGTLSPVSRRGSRACWSIWSIWSMLRHAGRVWSTAALYVTSMERLSQSGPSNEGWLGWARMVRRYRSHERR